jgi:WGR domain
MTNSVSGLSRDGPRGARKTGIFPPRRSTARMRIDAIGYTCRRIPPDRRKPTMAEPFQLPLFPDQASLTRRRPPRHEARFYRIAVWPDLFGRALLARQWGHIGSPARLRLDRAPAPEGQRPGNVKDGAQARGEGGAAGQAGSIRAARADATASTGSYAASSRRRP